MAARAQWWERKGDLLAAGGLFLAPFVFFYPLTLGSGIFYEGDFMIFYYPIRDALARAFVEGRLPLWATGIASGFPLLAEGQIGALYPVNQLLYRILPIQLALNYELLLHLGWLMAGMFVFARALRLARPAAIFSALAFAGSAFMMENLLITNMLATIAHLPWMLWLLENILTARRRPARVAWFVLLCLISTFQFLTLHAQYALLDTGILALYAATWWWQQLPSGIPRANRPATWVARIGQPFGIVVAASFVAVLLAAAQLIPTFELMRASNRAGGVPYEDFTNQSVEPQHLLLFLAPFALGGPYDVPGGVVGYLGIVPLFLALAAPFLRRERRTVFWLVLALAALALAFGRNNPIYPLLYRVPVFNGLRISGRFLYVVSFAAALLGAISFDQILRAAPKAGFSRALKVAVLALAALIGIEIVLVYQVTLSNWLALWTWLPVPLVLCGGGIVWWAARGKLTRPAAVAGLIGLTIFDLAAFAAVLLQSDNALVPSRDFFHAPQALAALDTRSDRSRILTAGALIPPFPTVKESLYAELGMVYGIDSIKASTGLYIQTMRDYTDNFSPGMLNLIGVRYILLPIFPPDERGQVVSQPGDKFALRLGKEKIDLPPTPASAVEVDSYLENGESADGTPAGSVVFYFDDGTSAELALRVGTETADWAIERAAGRRTPPIARSFPAFSGGALQGHTYRARLALARERTVTAMQVVAASDRLRIEHVRLIDDRGVDTLVDYYVGASNHSVVFRSDRTTVVENSDALPRAFLIHAAQVLDDAATLARLRQYTFNPWQMALLSEGQGLDDNSPEQGEDESVEIVAYQPERVVLAVSAKRPGYVILSDTWYPGWAARLDGKPTTIYRADYTFRAVKVDAGVHTIEFDYAPTSFYLGASVSAATLILLIGGTRWLNRQGAKDAKKGV